MEQLTILTNVTNMVPEFGANGLTLKSVTVVVTFQGNDNYFGGQVILTAEEDGISFTTSSDELQSKAIEKAKSVIANSKIPEVVEQPNIETPNGTNPDENKGE